MLRMLLLLPAVVFALAPVLPPAAVGQPVASASVGFVAAGGADFPAMRRVGAAAVKLLADWSELEPERGDFIWAPLDDAVAAASKAGLQVTLVLAYTPRWASLATGPELNDPTIYSRQPPKRIADWEGFVSRIVSRYKGRVRDWQVWTALSLPFYRGTEAEYFALLKAARAQARGADPSARIVLATPYGIDLAFVRRAIRDVPSAFDAISLSPRGIAPDGLLRPLAVLRERVLAGTQKKLWIEWDPRSVGERTSWPGQIVKVSAVARAFQVDRIVWAIDPAAAGSALGMIAAQVGSKPFTGYLVSQRALVFVFGDVAPAAVAWSTGSETPVTLEGEGLKVSAPDGSARQPETGGGKTVIALGAEPLFIAGLSAATAAEARSTLQARGLPIPPSAADFSQASEVSAKLGRANTEQGLYNMSYRGRANGAVESVEVGGVEAVRTNAAKDIVFIYFDVDDSFLYYVDGRTAVEISVEVRGAAAPQQLGFNVLYDGMTGYRFTPWQWVEAKDGWVTYTFRLSDANFSNTWGWDFAINAAGNKKEDLTVRSVTVRKVPRS